MTEKQLLGKYKDDHLFKEDIETLQKCIESRHPIIGKRCEDIGIITQSQPPIFYRGQRPQEMGQSQNPTNLVKSESLSHAFNLGARDKQEESELPIIKRSAIPKKKTNNKGQKIFGSFGKGTKKRQAKNTSKVNEGEVEQIKLSSSTFKRKKVTEDDPVKPGNSQKEPVESTAATPIIILNDSSCEIQEGPTVIKASVNSKVSIYSSKTVKNESDKEMDVLSRLSQKSENQEECTYSAPEVVLTKGRFNNKGGKGVAINVTKSRDSEESNEGGNESSKYATRAFSSNAPTVSRSEYKDDTTKSETVTEHKFNENLESVDDVEIRLNSETALDHKSDARSEQSEYNDEGEEYTEEPKRLNNPKKQRSKKRLVKSEDSCSSENESEFKRKLRKRKNIASASPSDLQEMLYLPDEVSTGNVTDSLQPIPELDTEEIDDNDSPAKTLHNKDASMEEVEEITESQ